MLTYKDDEGKLKNIDCVVPLISEAHNKLCTLLLSKIEIDKSSKYNFRVLKDNQLELIKLPVNDDRKIDFEKEELLYSLTESEVKEIKSIVFLCMTTFFDWFNAYFSGKKSDAKKNRDGSNVNLDLSSLLNVSNGAKIKFLEDFVNVYLALDGQSFFDIVSYLSIMKNYTFGSIFAITSLYFAANNKIRGYSLLQGAQRKVISNKESKVYKGELHTSDGLLICYSKQIRLTVIRSRDELSESDVTYEPVKVNDGDASYLNLNVSLPQSQAGNSNTSIVTPDNAEELYTKTQRNRLLIFGGDALVCDLQSALLKLHADLNLAEIVDSIPSTSVSSLIKILELFEKNEIGKLMLRLKPYLYLERQKEILDVATSIQDFISPEC